MKRIKEAYDAEQFRAAAHKLSDQLADYLAHISKPNTEPVLPWADPDELAESWDFDTTADLSFTEITERFLRQSNHLHHPRYVGHQVTSPLPFTALSHFTAALLNNSSAVYEMGPANMAMERQVIRKMSTLLGLPGDAGGIFTHGGSAGNLTGLLAARQAKADWDIWEEGYQAGMPMAFLVSEQAHYSIARTVRIMGMGAQAAITLPTDDRFRLKVEDARRALQEAKEKGIRVVGLAASACSTATGTYDPLEPLADFCEKHNLWFHVDAAHGAGAIMSETYDHYLKGIHRADSLVIDFHKMFLLPSLNTLVLFKDGKRSYETFAQSASYLFEHEHEQEWYNGAKRTLECTKSAMGFIAYTALSLFQQEGYREYIDRVYGLARDFARMLQFHPSFELAVKPESNIVCFRYTNDHSGTERLNQINAAVRKKMLEQGRYYLVQTVLNDKLWLRTTLINPLTTQEDLMELLHQVEELAREGIEGQGL